DRLGERLLELLFDLLARCIGKLLLDRVAVLVVDVLPERVDALGHDVDFQVSAGHGWLRARRGLLLLLASWSLRLAGLWPGSLALRGLLWCRLCLRLGLLGRLALLRGLLC